jgi:hypothetical protein
MRGLIYIFKIEKIIINNAILVYSHIFVRIYICLKKLCECNAFI